MITSGSVVSNKWQLHAVSNIDIFLLRQVLFRFFFYSFVKMLAWTNTKHVWSNENKKTKKHPLHYTKKPPKTKTNKLNVTWEQKKKKKKKCNSRFNNLNNQSRGLKTITSPTRSLLSPHPFVFLPPQALKPWVSSKYPRGYRSFIKLHVTVKYTIF